MVLNVCGLHLGFLGCYGNDWVATPNLDRLAAEGVVFDQHFADTFSRTGEPSARYRFPVPGEAVSEEVPGLMRLLEAHGVSVTHLLPPSESRPSHSQGAGSRGAMLREVLTALERPSREALRLVWADLPGLLPPWTVAAEFLGDYFDAEPGSDQEAVRPWCDPPVGPVAAHDEATVLRLQDTYAAAVSQLDHELGQLLEQIEQRCLTDELLLCVTADRGLALGEHGILGEHRPWLHDELVHLPLILRLPGGAEAGRRIPALTQPLDLVPTLLAWLGLPLGEVHGQDLLPLVRGEVESVRAYACSGWQLGEAIEWALRTPEWAFLLPVQVPAADPPRSPQLYVRPDDRWEVNNVLQHHLELGEHFEQTLRAFVEATRQPGRLRMPLLREREGR